MPKLFDTDNSAAEDKRGNPRIFHQKHIKPLKTSILDLIIMHLELRLRRSLDMKYTLLKHYGTEYYIIHVYMHDLH